MSTAAALVLGLGALALFARARYRRMWLEIFRLRREIAAVRDELLSVRKESVLQTLGGCPRLPPMMPSQNGEDVVLWYFFEGKRSGFFVEVGAYDGIGFSNSYIFEAVGWSGLLVEAAPAFFRAAESSRPHSRVVHGAAGNRTGSIRLTIAEGSGGVGTLSSATPDLARIAREGGQTREIEVPMCPLNSLLENVHEPIDFVSIDVEGCELAVLEGFDLDRFAPRVLVIEDNTNGVDRRVPDFLAQHSYVERFRLEENVFYTHRNDTRTIGWRG